MKTPDHRYHALLIGAHWLTLALLIAVYGLIELREFYPKGSDARELMKTWHVMLGLSVFALVLVRLAWRIGHKPPALPAHMPAIEGVAAHASHHLLYVLMLAIPLSGWLMSSAKGFQTVWFGVLPLPDLLTKDKALGNLLETVHVVLNYTLIAVLLGHVGAALKHHFIDRDEVLTRMLPRRKG